MPEFSLPYIESPKVEVLDWHLQIQSAVLWTPLPDDRVALFLSPVDSSHNSIASLEKAH